MTIVSQLKTLRSLVNPSPEGSASLWLHQGTAVTLFIFCLLVSSLQYFGEPIQCVQDQKDEDAAVSERVINSFCFISSTYTVSKDGLGYGCDTNGKYYANQGVGPIPADEEDTRKHSYYIWIPFVLFFQAFTFLVPNSYWTYCEGGLIERLLSGVAGINFTLLPEESKKKMKEISIYFHKRLKTHQFFVFAWVFHDFLAFGIVVGNFFLTDFLLGGRFKSYGTAVLGYDSEKFNCWNPVDDVFPKVTKCTFYKFGAGGGLQNFDSLCVMALNVVNEKIYIILWFWFLTLIPLSLCCLLLKIGIYCVLSVVCVPACAITSGSNLSTLIG